MRQKKNRKVAKKICLLFVLFFHSNSIRLLLWKWHTHTREKTARSFFFDFPISPFSLFLVLILAHLRWDYNRARDDTREVYVRDTQSTEEKERKISHSEKESFELVVFFCWSFLGALQFQGFRFGWVCYSCISISMLFIVIAFVIATIW